MGGHRVGSDQQGLRDPLPLESARTSFALLVAGPSPLALDGRRFSGLPNRVVPLDEVRTRLMRRRCPTATRDQVWAHLVRRSRREGAAWTLACTGMALPALSGVARWMGARFPGDLFDVHAEVLSGFLGGLVSVDLSRPHVLPRLRWAAYRQGYAALMAALDAPTPVSVSGFLSVAPRTPWGHPDLVLAKAVRAAVLSQVEADLIGSTRLEEVAISSWAEQHGSTVGAAYKARSRAESRLVAFIREESRAIDPDDPAANAAMDRLPVEQPRRRGSSTAPAVDRTVSKVGADSGLGERGSTSPAPNRPSFPEDLRCV